MQVLKLLSDNTSQNATLKQLHNSIGPTQTGAATPRPSFSSPIGDVDMSHTSFFYRSGREIIPATEMGHNPSFEVHGQKNPTGETEERPAGRRPAEAQAHGRIPCS